jgi:hypothetical protein
MKKVTAILLFYVFYFFWLFAVTYLTFNADLLNYFTAFVILFYIVFLREKGDVLWFFIAGLIPVAYSLFDFSRGNISLTTANIKFFPPWLALAWSTTVLALRKIYLVINSK